MFTGSVPLLRRDEQGYLSVKDQPKKVRNGRMCLRRQCVYFRRQKQLQRRDPIIVLKVRPYRIKMETNQEPLTIKNQSQNSHSQRPNSHLGRMRFPSKPHLNRNVSFCYIIVSTPKQKSSVYSQNRSLFHPNSEESFPRLNSSQMKS